MEFVCIVKELKPSYNLKCPNGSELSFDSEEGALRFIRKTQIKHVQNPPKHKKKPLNAFLLFSQATRAELKRAHPEAGFGELSWLAGEEWKNLSQEERDQYEKNLVRYYKQLKEHQYLLLLQAQELEPFPKPISFFPFQICLDPNDSDSMFTLNPGQK